MQKVLRFSLHGNSSVFQNISPVSHRQRLHQILFYNQNGNAVVAGNGADNLKNFFSQ